MGKSDTIEQIYRFAEEIGLSQTETDLYLQLIKEGSSTFTELSRKCKIPRTTVYENIERLINKGLVTQVTKGSTKKLIAEDPRRVETLLMNQQIEYQSKLDKISNINGQLGDFVNLVNNFIPQGSEKNEFSVRYFQGVEGFLDVHQRTLNNQEKEILFISNMDEWKKVFTDEFAYKFYVPERIEKKIFAKTLAIDTKVARDIRKNDKLYFREMRFLPEGFEFEPTLIISDKEISLMTSTKPYTAILIENVNIAKLFRDMFNFLWSVSK